MMQITEIIRYLRENITSFNVGGAAELAAAQDDSRLHVENGRVMQTLYAMLGNVSATEDTENPNNPRQKTDQRLVIFACFDNTKDRTGQHGQQLVPALRTILLRLLFNQNRFDTNAFPLQYVGDGMVQNEMDRARYWHKFEFRCSGLIDITDGESLTLDDFNRMVNTWVFTGYDSNPIAVDDLQRLYDGELE